LIAVGLLVLGLAGCNANDGLYTGIMSTDQGACGPGFDDKGKAPSTLLLRSGQAQFSPVDGVEVLSGQVNDAGHVIASATTPGADRKPFQQVFEGDRHDRTVTGRYATPRCRATVTLTRR
jgi:hypothetical protein